MTCGGSHLGFPIGIKNPNFLEDFQVIIPIFPIGFNVKLSPAVAAILNFISEQKT
jgi:hypothetical protein